MDFDKAPPFPISEYRDLQRAIPGLEGLYRLVRAGFDSLVKDGARILIVGAGGGREIETLAASPKRFSFIAVDPSVAMLEQARAYATALGAQERTTFIEGLVDDAPKQPLCDAATSLLVMHFLADDGAKASYLQAIRDRVRAGAPLILADISFDEPAAFERMRPMFIAHAELVGLNADKVARGPEMISKLPIISEARTRQLLAEAGFGSITPLFRGLWYALWLAQ